MRASRLPTHSTACQLRDVPELGEDTGCGERRRRQHKPLGAAAALGHQPHVTLLGHLGPDGLQLPTLWGRGSGG